MSTVAIKAVIKWIFIIEDKIISAFIAVIQVFVL